MQGLEERLEQYRAQTSLSRTDRLEARKKRLGDQDSAGTRNYYGDKKDKRIKYKTRDNDAYEAWESRNQMELEAYMRLNLQDDLNDEDGAFDAETP